MRVSGILILTVALLCLFGLVMLFSTSGPQGERLFGDPNHFIQRQLIWLMGGLILAWIASNTDYHRWLVAAWPIFALTLLLLALVYMPGIGLNIKGSQRWIRLPLGFTFQPSELAKFAVINLLAFWYGAKRRQRSSFKGGILYPGVLMGSMLLLIVFEPDYGATILIAGTGGLMMFVAGAPMLWLAPAGILAISGLGWLIWQNPQRMARIMAFLHPELYADREGYQLLHALYAFVRGGASGVGLGGSLQKQHYLPEAHTDFIYAIIAEEAGLLATGGVLALFVVFLLCGLRISGRAPDPAGRLMAFGITMLISFQAAINIGVVTGRLPTKGLPLPFISFGGTSLVMLLFMVGVLLNIARRSPNPGRRRA